jgi:hypothetical protein
MYVIMPMAPDNQIVQLQEEDNDKEYLEHAQKYGYIWETRESAQLALKAFTDFGRRYRMAHDDR